MSKANDMEAFRRVFSDRLKALSRVQGLLSRAEQERITIGALLRTELEALGGGDFDRRIRLQGPEVPLRNSVVQTLALALHELATNARKYGALAGSSGRLDITWDEELGRRDRRWLNVVWQESGVAMNNARQPSTPSGGYGRELIERALPYALGAKTTYELGEDGVRCVISLPLDRPE